MNKKQRQLNAATKIANRHSDIHPWQVAVVACNWASKADFNAFLCGLLHDSIEDGYATEGELRDEGIPDEVVRAVLMLTRGDGEEYATYIERIKTAETRSSEPAPICRLAKKVKLADATVNLARCTQNWGYETLEKRYRWVIEELS